jgi:multidrug transporter EmrE-like cation transporter
VGGKQVSYLFWIGLSALATSFGEWASKHYANTNSFKWALLMFMFYNSSTFAWMPAIRAKNVLAIAGVIWAVMTLVATTMVGVVLFKEQLTAIQWAGIGLALVAVTMLAS